MKVSKISLLSIVLLAINPVISLICTLLSMTKGKMNVFVFSFSLALIFTYFPIMFDTASNFYVYAYSESKEIFDVYTILPQYLKSDHFNYIEFILISVFITIYSWSKICSYNYSSAAGKKLVVFLLILFFTFHYRDLMDLNRNITAYAVVFLYIFYFKDRYKKGFLALPAFIVLSFYIHLSVIILWFLFLISRVVRLNTRLCYFLIFMSAVLGISMPYIMPALQGIFSLIPGPIGSRIYFYIYGSEFGVQVFSLGQALQKIFNFLIIFSAGIYALKLKKTTENKRDIQDLNFILMLISITMIVLMYMTLFERLNLATNFLYAFLLIKCYRDIVLTRLIISLIVIRSLVINFVIYIPLILFHSAGVFNESTDIIGFALKPLYTNTLYLLDYSNGYSDIYMLKHLLWSKE